jgi:hypothetical protein
MSLIHLECAACRSPLHCKPEYAGQQGRCPKCGAPISVPGAAVGNVTASISAPLSNAAPDRPPIVESAGRQSLAGGAPPVAAASMASVQLPQSVPLWQASAPDMMVEIFRRKKSAVLVVFETPAGGSYAISRTPEANVRCYRTEDMNDAQLMQVLEQLGHMSQGMRNQKGGIGLQAEGQPLPFDLKGDRLGMTLDEFKKKYARQLGAVQMPFCSDSCPGQANQALWSEPWHVAAGLINARVDLPSEGNPPTVAGVRTDLFLYHFVDGKLFKMTVLFDTEAFHIIHDAMLKKQGPPSKENREKMEVTWENGVSTIKLVRGSMRPKKSSSLLYMHNALQKSAEGRAPQRSSDL